MRAPLLRLVLFAVLMTALNMIGIAGIVHSAYSRDSSPAVQGSVSSPSPTAAFSERKKTAMSVTTHKAALPHLDMEIPSHLETATFGLG
jgi:hypothetical protein